MTFFFFNHNWAFKTLIYWYGYFLATAGFWHIYFNIWHLKKEREKKQKNKKTDSCPHSGLVSSVAPTNLPEWVHVRGKKPGAQNSTFSRAVFKGKVAVINEVAINITMWPCSSTTPLLLNSFPITLKSRIMNFPAVTFGEGWAPPMIWRLAYPTISILVDCRQYYF